MQGYVGLGRGAFRNARGIGMKPALIDLFHAYPVDTQRRTDPLDVDASLLQRD